MCVILPLVPLLVCLVTLVCLVLWTVLPEIKLIEFRPEWYIPGGLGVNVCKLLHNERLPSFIYLFI